MLNEMKKEIKIFQKDEIFKSLFQYNYFFTYLYKAFLEFIGDNTNIDVISVSAQNLIMPMKNKLQSYYGDLVATLNNLDIISIEMDTGRFTKTKFNKNKSYLNRLYANQLPKVKNKNINNYRNIHKVTNISFINSDYANMAPHLITKYVFMQEGTIFARDDDNPKMYLVRLDLVKEIAYNENESKFIRLLRILNATSYEELEKLAKGDETMEEMVEYVRNWCLESEKDGKEIFIENLREEAKEEGREIGAEEKSINIANLLLKDNVAIEKIMQYTGLSKEEILSIK